MKQDLKYRSKCNLRRAILLTMLAVVGQTGMNAEILQAESRVTWKVTIVEETSQMLGQTENTDEYKNENANESEQTDENEQTNVQLSTHQIEEFPLIRQLPQLRTGCEVTALAMVLSYYGYPADKVNLAMNYLPRTPITYSQGNDGRRIGPDMDQYFVGDPSGEGIIC